MSRLTLSLACSVRENEDLIIGKIDSLDRKMYPELDPTVDWTIEVYDDWRE